jgi:hypothetical protein
MMFPFEFKIANRAFRRLRKLAADAPALASPWRRSSLFGYSFVSISASVQQGGGARPGKRAAHSAGSALLANAWG